jgi:peptidyl-prolyl cis-trans isomerase A (cyclophilin A)
MKSFIYFKFYQFVKTKTIMMNRIKFLSVLGLIIIFIAGCEKGTWERQEREQIQTYLKSLGDTAYILKPSGLYYIELQEGTGRTPIVKDTITFWYKGMFLDRVVFNSNIKLTSPYKAIVGGGEIFPEAIEEGIKYMKEGGKSRFLTPSGLAYGATGIPGIIPGYTPIIWEVDLVSVKAGPAK